MVVALSGRWLKCSNFPERKREKKRKERDRMGWYKGKKKKVRKKKQKCLAYCQEGKKLLSSAGERLWGFTASGFGQL